MAEGGAGPPRLAALDALRGAALCGMVAYHTAWDLSALGWPVPPPSASLGWTVLGDAVAGVFLLVSGIGLALARPRGVGFALRRLAVLLAAGTAVTVASFAVAPEAPILFGILQCIAASNALALPVLAWPVPLRLALAAAAAAAPALLRSALLDPWPAAALGLGAAAPLTLDYRPVLPWLALVLLGTVLGDGLAGWRRGAPATFRPGRRPGALEAGLARLGRHSLAVYLLHQPLLYGALLALSLGVAAPGSGGDPFLRQCRADCEATGAVPKLCAAACACTTARVAGEARAGVARLTAPRLDAIGRACRAAAG